MKGNLNMHLPREDSKSTADSMGIDLDAIFGDLPADKLDSHPESKRVACPECQGRGKESFLVPYQINFKEAMYLCPVQSCSYPMKEDRLMQSFVFERDASTLSMNSFTKSVRKSQRSSGYSTFFEDFDFDSFLDSTNQPTVPSQRKENPLSPAECDKGNVFAESIHEEELLTARSNSGDNDVGENIHEGYNHEPVSDESHGTNLSVPDDAVHTQSENETENDPSEEVPVAMDWNEHTGTDNNLSADENEVELETLDLTAKLPLPPFNNKLIQWLNSDNLCWLDAIMQVLVSSRGIRAIINCAETEQSGLLKRLIVTYDKHQTSYHEHLANSENNEQLVVDSVIYALHRFRSHLLDILRQNSSFVLGEFQSLLEMFPMVLMSDPVSTDVFKIHLLWEFHCETCGHRRARRSQGQFVTLPHTLCDFHPLNAQFHRPCYECKSETGLTRIHMEKMPLCLAFHFQNGLPHSNLHVLDFAVQGQLYYVFAVVQYVVNPFKHFITWVKDVKTNKWLRCDDLQSPVCVWQNRPPKIPSKEIHMVFWERQIHCNPLEATKELLSAVINEEATAVGEDIPVEHYFAHEDETIVIKEDAHDHENHGIENMSQKLVQQVPQPTDAVTSTVKESTSEVIHVTDTATTMSMRDTPAFESNPITPDVAMKEMTQNSFQFHPSMFANGGLTLVPNSNDGQTIQLIAPSNTCSIFIMNNDNKNNPTMPFHSKARETASTRSTPCSFINNPHSYNMIAQGSNVACGRKIMTHNSVKRPKRHYRLSGYSRHDSQQFSPMKVANTPYTNRKSSGCASGVKSDRSSNSKAESETYSEVSELSDLLPDIDIDNSRCGSTSRDSTTSYGKV